MLLKPIQNLNQGLLRDQVYPLASEKFKKAINPLRLAESIKALETIGGKGITLKTEDGISIQAMFFDVNKFHERVVKMGGAFFENDDGALVLRLYDDRAIKLFEKKFNIDMYKVDDHTYDESPIESVFNICKEVVLIPQQIEINRLSEIHERTVTILTQGNGQLFEFRRKDILKVLLTGQSCLTFNIRGVGSSTGSPNELGTYSDIEAVYQYAKSKGYKDAGITVCGRCLGSGFATELAKKYPIHLVLDRPFAKIGDIIVNRALIQTQDFLTSKLKLGKPLQILQSTVQKTGLSFLKSWFQSGTSHFLNQRIISYDNASKFSKVEGSLLLVQSEIDEVIPSFSQKTLREQVQSHPRGTIHETNKIDHNDPWDEQTQIAYLAHLAKFGLLRRFPETPL